MRLALLVALAVAPAGIAAAIAQPGPVCRTETFVDHVGEEHTRLICDGEHRDETRGDTGSDPDGPSGDGPTQSVGYLPELGTAPDGSTCIYFRAVSPYPPGLDALRALALHNFLEAGYDYCPGADPVTTPVVDPAVFAVQWWRQQDFPVPQPHIAPGEMIVGLEAFLEARTRLDFPWPTTQDTPSGQLVVEITSEISVEWGDGTVTGPHRSTGGPHPDGDITHTYQHDDTHDVVVTQTWTGRWRIGAASGTLTTETVGTIDDFRVKEYQAVLRNP